MPSSSAGRSRACWSATCSTARNRCHHRRASGRSARRPRCRNHHPPRPHGRPAGGRRRRVAGVAGIELTGRVALGAAGEIVAELDFAQWMTSWSRLYESLRAPSRASTTGQARRSSGSPRTPGPSQPSSPEASGSAPTCSIGADGIRSTVRRLVLRDAEPVYGGYIAWRCLTDERDLSSGPGALRLDLYSMCIAPGVQAVGYPVPGPDGSREPGQRQYNVVWYHPVAPDDLPRLLTDDAGRVHEGGIRPRSYGSPFGTRCSPTHGRTWHHSSPRRITRARRLLLPADRRSRGSTPAPRESRVDRGRWIRGQAAHGNGRAEGGGRFAGARSRPWRAQMPCPRISPGSNSPVYGPIGRWSAMAGSSAPTSSR